MSRGAGQKVMSVDAASATTMAANASRNRVTGAI